MGLSDELRRHAGPVWDRIFSHPFVAGLGDGTLPLESFKFYLVQDYRFLIDYARVLAVASAKAPDLEGMTRFAGLLHATLAEEMDLHRRYCAGFGIGAAELERAEVAPGTAGYTNYLLSIAYQGSVMETARGPAPLPVGLLRDRTEARRRGGHVGLEPLRRMDPHLRGGRFQGPVGLAARLLGPPGA